MQQITIQSAGRWGGEIENRTFDLKKALEELIDNYRCGHEKATINLDFQLKDPEIFADPFHLIHLVDNLISNALKYAGEKAEIQISCKQEKPNRFRSKTTDRVFPLIPGNVFSGPVFVPITVTRIATV